MPDTQQRATESFTHRVRVRYAECDPMRVAHHASYAVWLEEARTEMLRRSGRSYAAFESRGAFLVITKLEIRFRRPIRYDDAIDITVEAAPRGRARLVHAYNLVLVERDATQPNAAGALGTVCAEATTELACVDASGRPVAMPADILDRGRDGVAIA